jgi:hypothetical protein
VKPIDQKGAEIAIIYSTVVDIVSDLMSMPSARFEPLFLTLAVMGFALSIIWSTKISLHQKVGLGAVFSLGLIIIAFAVVRAINITGRSYSDQAGLAVWGIAESSICMHLEHFI